MVELTFLGTGTSNGIPVIGCHCPVCTSADPRDRRSRTSAVVRDGERTILIDTATELRLQAIGVGLERVDAVLFTHAHADHTSGFDDLRRFNELAGRHLPVYAGAETAASLRERFAYAFVDQFPFYGGKPDLTLEVFDGPFEVFGREIVPISVRHGRTLVHGFRFGDLAYVTDAKEIPPSSMALLHGLDILVLNALRVTPHPTHLSLAEAVAVVEELRPRAAYLVHLSHELSHAEAEAQLPPGIAVAYDGLTVSTT
ncbi:MAG: phosphoribosyl 1,2-cyclic phosphate phosphodiesterase [Thermomicrobiales bacterium]|jgi:phosphoribosyl 1,2-cyclic phosphate phosphodiesterase|nr:phosphoribosyl 1,2-cyclic phosphate phosphodiesterase [Thermomicrobiales bacterium]